VIGLIFVIGGIIFHRKSIDPLLRRLSILYTITGLLLFIISAVVLLTQISV
jgi:predicted tellurium resistance membrane protein TerC